MGLAAAPDWVVLAVEDLVADSVVVGVEAVEVDAGADGAVVGHLKIRGRSEKESGFVF